jgi:hypothetical protein
MDIKEIIPKIKNYFRQQGNIDLVRDPFHDWNRLFSLFLIATFFVLVVEGFIFYKIGKGELFRTQQPSSASTNTVPSTILKNVADQYQKKENMVNAVIPIATPTPTPSPTATSTATTTSTTVVAPAQ